MANGKPPTKEEIKEIENDIELYENYCHEAQATLAENNRTIQKLNKTAVAESVEHQEIVTKIKVVLEDLDEKTVDGMIKVQQLDEDIHYFCLELDKYKDDIRFRTAELQQAQVDCAQVEEQRKESKLSEVEQEQNYRQGNEVLEQLQASLLAEQDAASSAKKELEQEIARTVALEAGRKAEEVALREKEAYLRKVEADRSRIKTKLSSINYEDLAKTLKDLRQAIEDERGGHKALEKDCEQFRANCSIIERQVKEHDKVHNKSEALRKKAFRENEQNSAKVKNLEERLAQLMLAQTKRMGAFRLVSNEVNNQSSILREQEEKVRSCQSNVSALRGENRAIQVAISDLEKKAEDLRKKHRSVPTRSEKKEGGKQLMGCWKADASAQPGLEPEVAQAIPQGFDLQI